MLFENLSCQMKYHLGQKIIGMCQNDYCKQPSRKVCFDCIKNHQKNDKKFNIDDIKNEKGIQVAIDEFKNYRIDVINNTILQCEIQQYLLHSEMLGYLKFWDFKFNQLNNIIEQVKNFYENQWQKITMDDFILNNEKNQNINSYLDQFQQQIFKLEDLKDNYIKQTIIQQKCDENVVFLKQNLLIQEITPTILKNQSKIFDKIQENVFFKSKQQKESPFITLYEFFIREGYQLKTNNMVNFFSQYYHEILQNKLEEYQNLQIKSNNLVFKRLKIRRYNRSLDNNRIIDKKNNKNPKAYFIKDIQLYILQVLLQLTKRIMLKGLNIQILGQIQIVSTFLPYSIKDGFCNRWKNIRNLYRFSIRSYKLTPNMIGHILILVNLQFTKAWSLFKQDQFKNAIDMYDQVLKLNPRLVEAYYRKANALNQLNQFDEAIEFCDKALQLDSNYVDAYDQKGITLTYQNKFEEAIIQYNKSIQIDAKNPDMFGCRGEAYEKLGKYQDAIENYQQIIKMDQSQVDVYETIAQLYLKLKDIKQAKQYLELYLKYEPNDQQAQQQLQEINKLK